MLKVFVRLMKCCVGGAVVHSQWNIGMTVNGWRAAVGILETAIPERMVAAGFQEEACVVPAQTLSRN